MYTYQCTTVRVIDGNTVDASIDLGFNVVIKVFSNICPNC